MKLNVYLVCQSICQLLVTIKMIGCQLDCIRILHAQRLHALMMSCAGFRILEAFFREILTVLYKTDFCVLQFIYSHTLLITHLNEVEQP